MSRISRKIRFVTRFLIPNMALILKGKVMYEEGMNVYQKVIVKGLGRLVIGKNCTFGYPLGGRFNAGRIEIQPRLVNSKIQIGDNAMINNNLLICSADEIVLGDQILIGERVTILDHEAHQINPMKRHKIGEIGKVFISRNVWIGNNVTILKNSNIGENCIVAASAVVNGDFSSNKIIGGIPAKELKDI